MLLPCCYNAVTMLLQCLYYITALRVHHEVCQSGTHAGGRTHAQTSVQLQKLHGFPPCLLARATGMCSVHCKLSEHCAVHNILHRMPSLYVIVHPTMPYINLAIHLGIAPKQMI